MGGISPSVNWDLRFIRSSRDHDASSVIAALAFYPTDLCQGEKQIHFSFTFHLCVIFDTFLIYAYSTLFRCFQIICNDSLLLFSSKSMYSQGLYIIIIRLDGLSICKIF